MLRRGHSNQLQRFIHKALLQHFVYLVQYQVAHTAKVGVTLADVVQQASGSTNQHMAASLQLIFLRFEITSAGNSQHLDIAFAQDFFHFSSNLLCQLTCRRNYQCLHVAFGSINFFCQWYQERQCLACTRLRTGDYVTSGKQRRDCLLLYRHRLFDAHFLKLLYGVGTNL